MDLNQYQGQFLINHGYVSHDCVFQAYQVCRQRPEIDLCQVLEQQGQLRPDQAQMVRAAANRRLATQFQYSNPQSSGVSAPSVPAAAPAPVVPAVVQSPVPSPVSSPMASAPVIRVPAPVAFVESGEAPKSKPGVDLTHLGGYEIRRRIGGGGMGDVFVVYCPLRKREVAMKIMKPTEFHSVAAVTRFLREAETMAQLDHPNLVTVHDHGKDEGFYYLVMDLIEGQALDRLVKGQGPLDLEQAAEIVQSIARGLDYAHKRGILHRDIKPANILLRKSDGAALLTDFGVAGKLEQDSKGLTQTGQVIGTPRYMSPEQVTGKVRSLDQRTDVYSLGATLYELLVGQPPFVSASIPQLVREIVSADPASTRALRAEVPLDLDTICLKCLEKEPHMRYFSALELADDLERYTKDETIMARPLSKRERAQRWARRNAKLLQGAGLGVASVLVLLSYFVLGPIIGDFRSLQRQQQIEAVLQAESESWNEQLSRELSGIRKKLMAFKPSREDMDLLSLCETAELRIESLRVDLNDPEKRHWRFREALRKKGASVDFSEAQTARATQQLRLRELASEMAYTMALLEQTRGQQRKAEAYRGQAYELDPLGKLGQRAKLELGESLLAQQLYAKAESLFRTLIDIKDAQLSARARFALAQCCLRQGALVEASGILNGSLAVEKLPSEWRDRAYWFQTVTRPLNSSYEFSRGVMPQWTGFQRNGRAVLARQSFNEGKTRMRFEVFDEKRQRFVRVKELLVEGKVENDRKFFHMGGRHFVALLTSASQLRLRVFEWTNGRLEKFQVLFPNWKYRNLVFHGLGNFRGTGRPVSLWSSGKEHFLWFDEGIKGSFVILRGARKTPDLRLLSFHDFDNDGCDDVFVFCNDGGQFKLQVYKGRASVKTKLDPVYEKRLGRSPGRCDLRVKDNDFQLLFPSNRDEGTNLGLLFGADMSPELSDSIWALRHDGRSFSLQSRAQVPFSEHHLYDYLSVRHTGSLFATYPESLAMIRERLGSGERLRELIFQHREKHSEVVMRVTGGQFYFGNFDSDPELELMVHSSSRVLIYGLPVTSKVSPVAARSADSVDLDRVWLASAWLQAGDFEAARQVFQEVLADPGLEPRRRSFLRLQLAKVLGATGATKEARLQCLKAMSEDKSLAYEALKAAEQYAQDGQDFEAALSDLQRLRSLSFLSVRESGVIQSRIQQLRQLAQMKPIFVWDAEGRKDLADWGVINPHVVERRSRSLVVHGHYYWNGGLVRAVKYKGGPFRMRARVRAHWLDRNTGLAFDLRGRNEGQQSKPMSLFITQRGLPNDPSTQRTVFEFQGRELARIEQLDRDAVIDFDLLVNPGDSTVQLRVDGPMGTCLVYRPLDVVAWRGPAVMFIHSHNDNTRETMKRTQMYTEILGFEFWARPETFEVMPLEDMDELVRSSGLVLKGQNQKLAEVLEIMSQSKEMPERAELLFMAGLMYSMKSKSKKAVDAFAECRKLSREVFKKHFHYCLYRANSTQIQAILDASPARSLDTTKLAAEAIKNDDWEAAALICEVLGAAYRSQIDRGFYWIKVGNYVRAERVLSQFQGSNRPWARFCLGLVFYKQRRYAAALWAWGFEKKLSKEQELLRRTVTIHAEYMVRQKKARKKP